MLIIMEQGLVVSAVDLVWTYDAVLGALLELLILCSSRMLVNVRCIVVRTFNTVSSCMWVNVRCIVVRTFNTVSSCMWVNVRNVWVTKLIQSNGTSSILDTPPQIQIRTDVNPRAISIAILEDHPGDGQIRQKQAGVSVYQFIYIKKRLLKLCSVDSLLLLCLCYTKWIFLR